MKPKQAYKERKWQLKNYRRINCCCLQVIIRVFPLLWYHQCRTGRIFMRSKTERSASIYQYLGLRLSGQIKSSLRGHTHTIQGELYFLKHDAGFAIHVLITIWPIFFNLLANSFATNGSKNAQKMAMIQKWLNLQHKFTLVPPLYRRF